MQDDCCSFVSHSSRDFDVHVMSASLCQNGNKNIRETERRGMKSRQKSFFSRNQDDEE